MAETTQKTQEESALLDHLNRIDGEAESSKAEHAKGWDENMKLVRSEGLWKSNRNPLFLINLIANQYERKVGMISEAKPTFSVVSRVAEYTTMAKVLGQTCTAILESVDFPLTLERMARFGMTCGCSFISTEYDVTRWGTEEDIVISCLDPRSVYVDPAVTEAAKLAKEAEYIRIDHVMSLAKIARTWPGIGSLVKPSEQYSTYARTQSRNRTGVVSAAMNLLPRPWRPSENPGDQGPVARALVQEYLINDPDVGSWPGGRRVVRAGDLILDDRPNRYNDGEPPIDMMDWRMNLDGPWGVDEVTELRKLNEAMNRLGDAIMQNALFNSQAWVIADTDAIDPTQWARITNAGGLIVKKRPMREFRREPPPQLPAYMVQILGMIPNLMDLVTGNAESLRTKSKSGLEAVVDGLQMTGSIMARIIARRFEALVARVGQRLISRIIQFFDADRLLNYYSLNGELVNYLFERQRFRVDDKGRSLRPGDFPTLHRQFRFLVQPYSSLQTTKVQRAQMSLGLWQASGGKGFPFRRVLQHADVGDPDVLMAEARAEQESGVVSMPMPPVRR